MGNSPYHWHPGRPWASGGCTVPCLWADRSAPLLSSGYILEEHPRAPLYGLSSESGCTSGSWKVTLLSCQCLLRDLRYLSKDQLHGWLLLQLWRWGYWASIIPQLSLLISLSSTWAASSTLWWAVLASQRTSLCGSFLLLDLDWDSGADPHASSSDAVG